MSERRKSPRAEVNGDVILSVGEAKADYKLVNLSAGGALLAGKGPEIRIGRAARIIMHLEDGSVVGVDGRVVRQVSSEEGSGVAVAFIDLDPDTEGKLHDVVKAALSAHDLGPRGKIKPAEPDEG